MTDNTVPLFEVNPHLDRRSLAKEFSIHQRVQIKDVLTLETAHELHKILSRLTPWGLSWQAGPDGPHFYSREKLSALAPAEQAEVGNKISSSMRGNDYAFAFSSYPVLDAYLQKWNPGSPHDLLLEHINTEPFLGLVREVTGIAELRKADAQATFYAPGQFLAEHIDSHVGEGWRVAYVLNLTQEEWRSEWGGYLLFHDEDGDIVTGFKPRFNALNLFSVPQRHQVSYVPPFAPKGRLAVTGWLRDR